MSLLKSSLVLIAATGAVAFPSFPVHRRQSSLDAFIETETPIAKQGILNNIGAEGILVEGAAAGTIVASPSKDNPDCTSKNSWTWCKSKRLI
jgi:glucoamylase